jgi:hypothetical protein
LAVAVDIGVYDELPRGINAASREESDPKKIDELSALLDLLGRLECKKSEVIDYIVRTVRAEEKSISVDGIARYSVPSFDGEVELALSKPSGKPSSNHTTFNGGTFPTFFTTKEWEQFKNLVFPQRVQRIPGMINVLTINTDSATHDKYALMEEIEEDFKERVAQGNVTEQMKKLSGILFRGAWENLLWLNEVTCCPIPKSIAGALQQLTCD